MVTNKQVYIFLFLFLAIGALLRFYELSLRPLWLDEAAVVAFTDSSSKLFSNFWNGSHPPFYYLSVFIWRNVFGDSEFALRTLSAAIGLLGILAMYWLAKELFDKRAALLSSFLAALNYFQIFYSQQARGYSLVFLLSALSFLYFIKTIRQSNYKNLYFYLYILFTVLGLYTHYWMFFIILAQFIYLVCDILIFKRIKNFFLPLLGQLIGGFLFIPWLWVLSAQINTQLNDWMGVPSFNVFFITFEKFIYGNKVFYLILGLSVAVYWAYASLLMEKKSQPEPRVNQIDGRWLLTVYLLAPLIAAWLVSHYEPLYYPGRYEIVVLPAFLLIAGRLWSRIDIPLIASLGLALVLLINGSATVIQEARSFKELIFNDKMAIKNLLEKAGDNDVIIFTDLSRPVTEYYLGKLNKHSKEFLRFSYPLEMEGHASGNNRDRIIEDRKKLIKDAENIVAKIENYHPGQKKKITVFYQSGDLINFPLERALRKNFILAEEFILPFSRYAAWYDRILIFETN